MVADNKVTIEMNPNQPLLKNGLSQNHKMILSELIQSELNWEESRKTILKRENWRQIIPQAAYNDNIRSLDNADDNDWILETKDLSFTFTDTKFPKNILEYSVHVQGALYFCIPVDFTFDVHYEFTALENGSSVLREVSNLNVSSCSCLAPIFAMLLRSGCREENENMAKLMKNQNIALLKKDGKNQETEELMVLEFGFENLRLYAWISFLCCLTICGIIATALDLVPEDNPIFQTFGKNNPCLWLDYYPASIVGSQMWILSCFFFCSYCALSILEAYANVKKRLISICAYGTIVTLYIYCFFSFIFFTSCFVTHPYENTKYAGKTNADGVAYAMISHTLPYTNVALALTVISCLRFWTYVNVHHMNTFSQMMGYAFIIPLVFLTFFKVFRELHYLFPSVIPEGINGWFPAKISQFWIVWIIWGNMAGTVIAPSTNTFSIPIRYTRSPNPLQTQTWEETLLQHPSILLFGLTLAMTIALFFDKTGCDSFPYEPDVWYYCRYTIYIGTWAFYTILWIISIGTWCGEPCGQELEDKANVTVPKYDFTFGGIFIMLFHIKLIIGRMNENVPGSHLSLICCSAAQMMVATIVMTWLKRMYLTETNYIQVRTVLPYIIMCWTIGVTTWRFTGILTGNEHKFLGFNCHSTTFATGLACFISGSYQIGLQIYTYNSTPNRTSKYI